MNIAYRNVFYIKFIFQDNSSYEIDNATSLKRVIKNNFDFMSQWEIKCCPLLDEDLVDKLSTSQVKEVIITLDVKHENGAEGDCVKRLKLPEIELLSQVKPSENYVTHKLIIKSRK